MELLQYTFFQYSLIACLLSGIVCGLVGTYIVSRRMVFVSGGMAHASLGGVGICALAGWPTMIGAGVFALLTGWSVQILSRRKEVREDSAIAMLWALGMSVGIVCSYLSPEFLPALSGYLFGNILLIGRGDLIFLMLLTLGAMAVFIICMPQIVSIAFDREFSLSQKQPVIFIERIMMILVALSIVATLKVAGVVLVISLLSVPQMTANLFCRRFSVMCVWSVVVAVVGCYGGLAFSICLNVPCGASVVIVLIAIYMLVRTIKRIFGGFSLWRSFSIG